MNTNTFINVPVGTGTMTTVNASMYGIDKAEQLIFGTADDHVIAVLCDKDGSVVEWFTPETNVETIVNFATGAAYFVFLDGTDVPGSVLSLIASALHERSLYSDCFHWSEQVEETLPESWTNGADPLFTSTLGF